MGFPGRERKRRWNLGTRITPRRHSETPKKSDKGRVEVTKPHGRTYMNRNRLIRGVRASLGHA